MKKILNILYSTRLTGILFIVFAVVMAIATFIENDFDTQTAMAVVYHAWWFELIMIIFMINFIGNISKYKLLRKEKISVLVFHLAFILIILGAGITRYISFEGIMPIYEHETTDAMLSDKAYIKLHIDDGKEQKVPVYKNYLFSSILDEDSGFTAVAGKFLNLLRGGNGFNFSTDFKGKPVEVEYVKFISHAFESFVPDKNGKFYLKIVETGGNGRHEHYLQKGEVISLHNFLFAFDRPTDGAVNILSENNKLKIKTSFDGTYMIMSTQERKEVAKDSVQDFHLRSLYQFGNLRFVVPEPPLKGKTEMISGGKNQHFDDLLRLKVRSGNEERIVDLFGNSGQITQPVKFTLNGLNFRLSYGAKQIKLPFAVKLRDFQLDRYPGSMSPRSYASEITVIDQNKTFDYRIYMNHVLDYKGYRLFQSSYNDQGEVEQTFLSVNHDKLGTWTTYLGYGLLFLGLIFALMEKKTRFGILRKKLRKLKEKNALLTLILLLTVLSGFSQEVHRDRIDSLLQSTRVSKAHAKNFGSLIIQDEGGRMKPVNTFASELLRKVSKKDTWRDMNADQVLVSMVTNPRAWFFVPFIYIKKENTKVRDLIGIPEDQKYARFADLFTERGEYKLKAEVAAAHKKKIKNKYEESILNIDGRANLLYGALNGGIYRFFPVPGDENHKWISQIDVVHSGLKGNDSLFVAKIIPLYSMEVKNAVVSGDFTNADKLVEGIRKFQDKYGGEIMPSHKKISLELFYNKYDIFKGLFWKYMLASLILFIVVIINIFNKSKTVRILISISTVIILLLFIYHTVGLGIRWYISGHAPWSNGYESMIYVAWATMLFGLIFGKRSALTLAATTFVTSMLLMVAHWNWMDPSIGNLVPVLDSYWLMVHVAIIVASYGPFTISMILGMLALILYMVTTEKNKQKIKLALDEITVINEMSLTLGLVLLTIGNFLGGIWANESWGRYWGWDPKETWALISIMIYAFVLHMRLIPGLKGKYTFNVVSVFSFTAILMTYLGVNHLLSGLHSYASGESAPIPNQIWGWLGISLILSVLAYFKYLKFYKK